MTHRLKTLLSLALVWGLVLEWASAQDPWEITESIPLDAVIVQVVKDPNRSFLYALNRTDSKVLFIDLQLKTITELYVGKFPTSMALNDAGTKMYVANGGIGSGTSGSYQIAVVDLDTQTKTHHFLTTYPPVNLVMGLNNRLYYNSGDWGTGAINSGGSTGIIDLSTETQLSNIGGFQIKSRMVVNDDRTKLYGQYIYSGNLGEMGVFDIENPTAFKLDRQRYSPYPYGWDYNNYCISANGNRLAYGHILFNADNLIIQYGLFSELVYALNYDASIAFGKNSIWDTGSFASTGDATPVWTHNLSTSVMHYDSANDCLYAFTASDFSIKKIEPTNRPDPSGDADRDGLDYDTEIAIGTNPLVADTDADGLDDGSEVENGLDPLVPNAQTPQMRALLTTLRRSPELLQLDSPVIWFEYGQFHLNLQLYQGEDLSSMNPMGMPFHFEASVPNLATRQFFQIHAK